MGLNSGQWGAIVGAAASAYSPALGGQVSSLFQKNPPPQPVSQAIAAPAPVASTVPGYVWVVGGLLVAGVLVFVLIRATR